MTTRKKLLEVRRSKIQGLGAFATAPIRKGTRIIEYLGERISPKEADRRYDDDATAHPHVLLFSVDSRTVIDAGVSGNDARFINHCCDPNCEAVTDRRRVFIEALRDITPGEELLYDYNLTRQDDEAENLELRYACRCGSKNCRGTMLTAKKTKKKRRPASGQT